ncbi:MAG: UDP-N-acetylmuramoyl-L-alanyl-D-glutamate--2,6-diaminopimelate ligase [Clostridiales bacterium]|nr:UDP-N-acetylmuramoyl-L-alanyl-D-glutamate--2,6-diaminopimelate ligase [Clostridiales bacterium]
MLLSQLLADIEYKTVKGQDVEIASLIYDSRKVEKGSVFVCLKGSSFDSHTKALEASKAGAAAIIAEHEVECGDNCTLIIVDDTRKALAYMSCAYFDYPAKSLKTVAITGTKGKTTTAAMIRYILEEGGIKTATIGTLGIVLDDRIISTNNTTPESYEIQEAMRLMVNSGYKAVVIEASSLGFKWHRTDGVVFDFGVFTNFSHDHIGGVEHESLEEYFDCKAMLFSQCKIGCANADDEKFEQIKSLAKCPVESFGFSEKADLRCVNSELINDAGFIGIHIDTQGSLHLSADVAVPGKFNAYNALAAISVCRHFDITNENIINGLRKFKVKGRVEPVKVSDKFSVLIDYAHNAISMENVLTTLRQYNPHRIITMFGAGGNRPKVRRYEMGETSGRLSDLSVITEDNSRYEDVNDIINDILVGMKKTDGEYVVVPNRREAIKYCLDTAQKGDIIVLAGKGHEDYQEIKGVKYHLDEREVIDDILKTNKY